MTELRAYPPHEEWHDHVSLSAPAWPDKVQEHANIARTVWSINKPRGVDGLGSDTAATRLATRSG